MFARLASKTAQYVLPTAGVSAGAGSSLYFAQNVKRTNTQTAYAWWGSSTPAPTTPTSAAEPAVAPADASVQLVTSPLVPTNPVPTTVMPKTTEILDNIDPSKTPSMFESALTPLDRLVMKENVMDLIHGTDITLADVRQRLDKYTDGQIKDAINSGESKVWVNHVIEDIKKDRLVQQHVQSPNGYKTFEKYMYHSEIIPVNKGVIDEIHVCQYQANKEIEDTYSFVKDLHSSNGSVLGVFDGHSGRDSSLYCAKNLTAYLDFFKYYGLSQDFMDPHVIQAADDHYIDLALGENAYKALTGACLLLSHITNRKIETLWAGDCRALLVRDNAQSYTGPLPQQHTLHSSEISNPPVITHTLPVTGTLTNNGAAGEYTELTIPHQIDLNYYEKQRLINEHPSEPDVIHRDRVKGGLQPTRAFGDAHYKKMAYYKLKYPHKDMTNWFPPYITAKPDHSVYNFHPKDRYVVLCSDGLTDAMSPFEISALLHNSQKIQQQQPSSPITSNLAQFLTTQALFQAGKRVLGNAATLDDVAQAFPRLPPGKERRRFHDDITVLVVKLNQSQIGHQSSDASPFNTDVKPPVPGNLRAAIAKGLLSNKASKASPTREFLNTGIYVEADANVLKHNIELQKESHFM